MVPLTTNIPFMNALIWDQEVGRRWSEVGLLNWLKLTFNKIFTPELWSKLWNGERISPRSN